MRRESSLNARITILLVTFKVLALFRAFLFAFGGIQAAKYFHKKLLDVILKAPISFFDVTPVSLFLV